MSELVGLVARARERAEEFAGQVGVNICDAASNARRPIKNLSRILWRLARTRDPKQGRDHLAELRYVNLFAWADLEVTVEPYGKKGPDIGVAANGRRGIIEVTRFRPVNSSLVELDDGGLTLPTYGDVGRDVRKVVDKISSKLGQLPRAPAAVAIWNDDGDLEEIEVRQAGLNLQRCDRRISGNLSMIIYGSPVGGPNLPPFLCFAMRDRLPPLFGELKRRIAVD